MSGAQLSGNAEASTARSGNLSVRITKQSPDWINLPSRITPTCSGANQGREWIYSQGALDEYDSGEITKNYRMAGSEAGTIPAAMKRAAPSTDEKAEEWCSAPNYKRY
jgi:hypothetical protein